MSITQEEIKKISINLAKIKPKNEEKLEKDINSILEYVDLLNEVDTNGINPTVSVIGKNDNILRKDEINKKNSREELLNCSKQKIIANQIAVDNIMN
ncbi:MAG: Asp-tRNA(Asn)/Glu-tRNA(Gln) amidotransferase subunit GatC [Candidatus Gracilibacteria bacterium]|nr:Asp-tRNA(Asn)/Glu-tRNA(Gln) amidotransferase subunit GatC [Candidatus Gracilibacteria bacterium]